MNIVKNRILKCLKQPKCTKKKQKSCKKKKPLALFYNFYEYSGISKDITQFQCVRDRVHFLNQLLFTINCEIVYCIFVQMYCHHIVWCSIFVFQIITWFRIRHCCSWQRYSSSVACYWNCYFVIVSFRFTFKKYIFS